MALTTVRNSLNDANPNNAWDHLRRFYDRTNDLGIADLLAAIVPRNRALSGLTSSATQVHDVACIVYGIQATAGTALTMVFGAAAGAGEVRVEYSATTGVPTFTFGDGALTAYSLMCSGPLPQGILAAVALATTG
jgi:hypothetical protein